MKKRTLLLIVQSCLLLQGTSLFAGASGQHPEHQLADDFEAYFRQHVGEENITGAAFAVSNPGGTLRIGTAGHTDTSRSQPIDRDTAFRVASVSKTFAAGLTAVLVNEGRFNWDDSVTDFLPDFRVDGDAGKVRIQHVLGQSTGLMPHAYDNLIEDGVPMDRIREQFEKLSFICTPGECYSYQNSIFSLIGPVIEKTTEKTYTELLEERLFRPLDMKTASVGYEPFVNNPNRAKPHVKIGGLWKTVRVKPNYYRVAPAAGVNASITDMGKWLTAQMGGHPAVIDTETVGRLTEPRVKTWRDTHRRYWRDLLTDAHYGLGWRIYLLGDHPIAYHSGWVSGYRADIAWSAEYRIGVVVLMNVEGNTIGQLTTNFWQMAFDLLDSPSRARDEELLVSAEIPGE